MTWSVQPHGNRWVVEQNGVTKSTHHKKQRAVQKARRLATSGARLRIHRNNGTIQKTVTVR